jgi:hypothetical protein
VARKDVANRREYRTLHQYHRSMPPCNSVQLGQKEGQITLAGQTYKRGHLPSLRDAARVYDVPESTLRGRVKAVTRDAISTY